MMVPVDFDVIFSEIPSIICPPSRGLRGSRLNIPTNKLSAKIHFSKLDKPQGIGLEYAYSFTMGRPITS